MISTNTLISQLKHLDLQSREVIMVHASMRAIGKVLGGPDQVHQAIMDAISPGGTLMMYVGCEPEYEAVGRGKFTTDEENTIYQYCPAFNSATARASRDYGILAEFFRSWPGVICSSNPGARIAALGDKASWLVANHPLNYGYGSGSPLAKLYENQGKILILESDLDQVTILHYAEHIAPIKEKRIKRFKVPLIKDGQRVWFDIEEYDTSVGIRQWPERFFATIVEKFIEEYRLQAKRIGQAKSYLLDVKSLVDFAVPIFIQAADKYSC
ncbi:aminoglycoside 3-N-acetyltransferase [Legionella lansingensis]|nr:aminoglycoside 3-N-acetyltransferase [Legionella lansingensis]